jgi:hypothetical protein
MSKYTGWCRNLFDMLSDGGAWGVPRSGLTFTKQGDRLVLTNRAAISQTADWRAYQQSDYEAIKRQFGLADIIVEDATHEKT